jgi:CDP-diacylglycerol--serine O-phosphatidyltransferase
MKLFTLPNLLTATNLFCGLLSIISSVAGRLDWAPVFLLLAAVFDFLDGFSARIFKSYSELGKQLDSLADIVSFGVAPGIMMMVVLVVTINFGGPIYHYDSFSSHVHYEWNNWINALFYEVPNGMDASIKYFPLIALIVPVLSMFRLAKFNIDDRQSIGFLGVPTPLNAFFLTFFPLLLWFDFEKWTVNPTSYIYFFDTYIVGAATVVMAFLMITEIPLMALKFKSFGWTENKLKFIFLLLCLFLFLVLNVWAIPVIVFLYLILSLFSFTKQKKENEIQSRN